MSRKLFVLLFVVALSCAAYSECDLEDCVVIGDWELNDDGWIDWSDEVGIDEGHIPPYFYEDTIGVTLNDYSLGLPASGYAQTLAIKLQDNGLIDEFMDNWCFCIDVTAAAATEGGWVEVYSLSANVEGFDWGDIGDAPAWHQDRWDGAGEVTVTLCWDYSDFKPETAPSYAEFIIATNGSGEHNLYFDNARLCTPEPATLALLGLGGLLLRRRR
jgi:hypothetical protein